MGRHLGPTIAAVVLWAVALSSVATARQGLPAGTLAIRILAERTVAALPVGRPRLYWRIETFPGRAQAQAAAGPWGLTAEYAGKAWLFTVGPKGASSPGGTKVAEAGPLRPVVASAYLLRINEPSGPPGSSTIVHTHPGTEAIYVLAGELCFRTPQGVIRVAAGRTDSGPAPYVPSQVSSCGSTDLHGFVMFVTDATKPFSTPATFP